MTQISAICISLLKGETLSIMNGFRKFSCTNLPREISRSIEDNFNVQVNRERVDHTSRYGHVGYYYKYSLKQTNANAPGIKKMKEYVKAQLSETTIKTTEQLKITRQAQMFV